MGAGGTGDGNPGPVLIRSCCLPTLLVLAGCPLPAESGKPDDTAEPVDTAVGACDAGDAPVAVVVPTDPTCHGEGTAAATSLSTKWSWADNPLQPGFEQVMSTPVVGDLDGDGVPEIVVTNFAGEDWTGSGVVTALAGDGSGTRWSVARGTSGTGGPALGDLDGDGSPEICTAGDASSVTCLDRDGNLLWTAGSTPWFQGAVAIADLDGDGFSEVIFGAEVFDAWGNLLWTGAAGTGYRTSFAADMDADPELEVVAGNTVYDTDGTVLWQAAVGDGFAGVADFDLDGLADVLVVVNGEVHLVDNSGTVVWTQPLSGGGLGGPPTVADFDNDDFPDVGVAGYDTYSVFDALGRELWHITTQDRSSSSTGSSVYDLDGDHKNEVMYADEQAFYILDGATGAVEWEDAGHASGTLVEYPVLADVDGDALLDVVIASNDYHIQGGWSGIHVLTDPVWTVPGRPVWNQHAYSISNVNDDLSIPAVPLKNPLVWNTFRAGGLATGPAHGLADPTVVDVTVCADACSAGEASLFITVANAGVAATGELQVEVVDEGGTVLAETGVRGLGIGETQVLGPVTLDRSLWTATVQARVRGVDGAEQCDAGNDLGVALDWPCE